MARVGTMEDIAEMLEGTGRYRCLRRVPAFENRPFGGDPDELRIGIVIDVEATGTDPLRDVPIEIAMAKFSYREPGEVVHLLDTFEALGEPPSPLSDDVVAITGLTMADLAGRRIDWSAAAAFAADANCFVAHNAKYDRAIVETTHPAWPIRPWACSLADVDWRGEAMFDRRLKDLLLAHDLFADGHRALADCLSLLHLLTLPLPRSCRPMCEAMLEHARQPTVVFFAEKAPYVASGSLKARGYRWADGSAGTPKCWWIEVSTLDAFAEAKFLYRVVYARGGQPTFAMISAAHRYRPLHVVAAARIPAPDLEEIEAGEP